MIDSLAINEWYEVLCPHIIGNVIAKQVIMLQLYSQPKLGELINVLLVGEAQSGKTALMIESSKIAQKGTYNGRKITGVGMLEKLIAFDGSCCLAQDELDKISKDARNSMLESMELGQVTISKHRQHYTCKARCNVLAGANPRGDRLNTNMSILLQTNFDMPFLSRFTMIIPFESLDPKWYPNVAVGIKQKNDYETLLRIKERIIEEKTKYYNVKVPDNIRIMVGREVKWLKDNSLTKDIVGPRTIHGFINMIKSRCRMNGVMKAREKEFDYIKKLFRTVYKY